MPRNKVCVCRNDPGTVAALEKLGFTVLTTGTAPDLPDELEGHADVLMCPVGGGRVVVHDSQTELARRMGALGYVVIKASHSFGAYPLDIAFNAAVAPSFAVARPDAIHPVLAEALCREIVPTRQGYAKCSTCFAGKNGVITEDAGLAGIFSSRGYEVLVADKGDVVLSGEHYGFLGGASGNPDEHTLVLNGELASHRNEKEIRHFLEKLGVEAVELKKGSLVDVGSIFFI